MKRFALLFLASSVVVWAAQPMAQGAKKSATAGTRSAATQAKAGATAGAKTVTITAVDSPTPKWDTTTIAAKPGETIHVVLKATGSMPKMAMAHNFVLFKPGTTQAQIQDFVNAAAMAGSTNYLPAAKMGIVLAHTPKVVGAGETSEVTFKAPATPGSYTYLCSFPGHYAMGMKGTLTVAK